MVCFLRLNNSICCLIWFVFFVGYLPTKLSLQKRSDAIESIAEEDKRVHTFLKGISPKVNAIR